MKNVLIVSSILSVAFAGCVLQLTTSSPKLTQGIPRWVLYERGLSDIMLGPPDRTKPDLTVGHGLCEWEILGQQGNEVYVWALCTIYDQSIGTSTSAPALIRLADDDSIVEVEMPNEGFGNVRALFPPDIADRINSDEFHTDAAMAAWEDHLAARLVNPWLPPLIVEQGVQLP